MSSRAPVFSEYKMRSSRKCRALHGRCHAAMGGTWDCGEAATLAHSMHLRGGAPALHQHPAAVGIYEGRILERAPTGWAPCGGGEGCDGSEKVLGGGGMEWEPLAGGAGLCALCARGNGAPEAG